VTAALKQQLQGPLNQTDNDNACGYALPCLQMKRVVYATLAYCGINSVGNILAVDINKHTGSHCTRVISAKQSCQSYLPLRHWD
jgi:hypothetical protein